MMLSSVPAEPVLRAALDGLVLVFFYGHIGAVRERLWHRNQIDPMTERELRWPRVLLVLETFALAICAGFFVYCLIRILIA